MNKKVAVVVFVLITILLTSCDSVYATAEIGEIVVAEKTVKLFHDESPYTGSGCELHQGEEVIVLGYGNDGDQPMYFVEIPIENSCFQTELFAYALMGNFSRQNKQ